MRVFISGEFRTISPLVEAIRRKRESPPVWEIHPVMKLKVE
jgi:hypothetical protein